MGNKTRRILWMNGQYTEKLESGGELIVTLNDWEIRYYFQGCCLAH